MKKFSILLGVSDKNNQFLEVPATKKMRLVLSRPPYSESFIE
jgi:hypothetical protein